MQNLKVKNRHIAQHENWHRVLEIYSEGKSIWNWKIVSSIELCARMSSACSKYFSSDSHCVMLPHIPVVCSKICSTSQCLLRLTVNLIASLKQWHQFQEWICRRRCVLVTYYQLHFIWYRFSPKLFLLTSTHSSHNLHNFASIYWILYNQTCAILPAGSSNYKFISISVLSDSRNS